ncbi:hypothetical protein TB1_026819 [Malus domestica]
MGNSSQACFSAGLTAYGGPWKKIWSARVPPKVKVGVWRICSYIIPTRGTFASRYVGNDLQFVLCNGNDESALHLVMDCCFSSCAWLPTIIRKPLVAKFTVGLHRGPSCPSKPGSSQVVRTAACGGPRQAAYFGYPQGQPYKEGCFVAACSKSFKHVSSPTHIKALATCEELLLAMHKGLQNLILKSDRLHIATALQTNSPYSSFIGHIVEDSKATLELLLPMRRGCPSVAHSALSYLYECAWFEETTDVILDVLLADTSL